MRRAVGNLLGIEMAASLATSACDGAVRVHVEAVNETATGRTAKAADVNADFQCILVEL